MKNLFRALPPFVLLVAVGCAPAPTPVVQATPTPAASATQTPAPDSSQPAPSATPVASTFQVTGTVQDDEIAKVSGATISAKAEGQDAVTATTGSDGRYALALKPGTYDITATKPGWTRRTQSVTVAGDMGVDFGVQTDKGVDPYFLSNTPEIEHVDVKEDAPGGPLTMTFNMSEPLTKDSQQNFAYLFQLDAGNSTPFIRTAGGTDYNLKADYSWDAEGKVFTMKYNFAYLPSGDTETTYTARLRQAQLDTKDPVTREPQFEDMHIVDADGKPLGKGRAQYAFLMQTLYTLAPDLISNLQYGYYTDQRRWNLTHEPSFRFTAAKDTVAPQLTEVHVNKNEAIGDIKQDVLYLTLNKPMRVAKDRDTTEFTRLDKDKALVVINVSKNKTGTSPVALSSFKPTLIEFSRSQPNLVMMRFPSGLFENYEWVEVTLDRDFLDPAGNRPDPDHSKLSGPVL